jgi:hypothetical protein
MNIDTRLHQHVIKPKYDYTEEIKVYAIILGIIQKPIESNPEQRKTPCRKSSIQIPDRETDAILTLLPRTILMPVPSIQH